jgi:hypothetical protein
MAKMSASRRRTKRPRRYKCTEDTDVREYLVERYLRDAKITEIYEGTTEIQKLVISRDILKDKSSFRIIVPPDVSSGTIFIYNRNKTLSQINAVEIW